MVRQTHVRGGPLAGLAISLLLGLALVAGIVLAGVVALAVGVCALVVRLAAPLRSQRGAQRDATPDEGLVIEGSYVVLDETPRRAAGATHRG